MHGVPHGLNLSRLHGATLTQVAIGEFQIRFNFTHPNVSISVEGEWRLTNSAGELVDRSLPNAERDSFRVHRILRRTVLEASIPSTNAIQLRFDNGWSLSIVDNSERYESFSIQPGDIFV